MKQLWNYISFKWRQRKNKKIIKAFARKVDDGHYLLVEELNYLDTTVGPGWPRMLDDERKKL